MISVIVPAYNAEKTIGACLDGLLEQTTPRFDASPRGKDVAESRSTFPRDDAPSYEIIVVDDGSTDKTRQVAESRGVRVLTQPNRGAAAARNFGAANARGDILLFIDADSVPDARWIEALVAPFVDLSIAGASGVKKTRQTNLWAQYVQLEYDYKYDRMDAHGTTDFIDSSTAAYRRDLFQSNGGFDTTLMEAEDTELSFRLAERGCVMVLVRDAIVYHSHPESLVEYVRRKYRYAIWRAAVYARHPRKAASDTRTPQAQKVQAALAFLLIPALVGAAIWNSMVWLVAALLALFVATTLQFAARCWRASPVIGLAAPGALLLTAYAGGAGALVGLFKRISS